MPRFLRYLLGAILLFATIGLVTCQSLLNASPLPSDSSISKTNGLA